MEEVQERSERSLLDTEFSRRRALVTGAWSVPVVAMAVSLPAAAASGEFDPATALQGKALGGAEGRYATGGNFTSGVVGANQDFRRAFSISNIGTTDFKGSLTVLFKFPRKWNEGVTNRDVDAFQNFHTVDLGGRDGGSIGGAAQWGTTEGTWVRNTGGNPSPNVWFRMDSATATLTEVVLPAGGTVWFALNATVPQQWIGSVGQYFPNGNRIYWRTDVIITAMDSTGKDLGTYGPLPDPGGNWADGIWYWNGGGPYAYNGGEGLYPAFGENI